MGLRASEPASLVPQCRVGQEPFQDRHAGFPLPRPSHAPTSPLTTLGLLGEPGTGLGCSPGQDLSDSSGSCPSGSCSRLQEQLPVLAAPPRSQLSHPHPGTDTPTAGVSVVLTLSYSLLLQTLEGFRGLLLASSSAPNQSSLELTKYVSKATWILALKCSLVGERAQSRRLGWSWLRPSY